MATYLMSYRKPVADAAGAGDAQALVKEKTEVAKLPVDAQGYRLYQGACMACHRADPSGVLAGSSFGVRPQLSLNTNLYSDSPTNAIHVVLNGITQPARPQLGRSEEHTSELQSPCNLVCRLLLEQIRQHSHSV